MNVIASSSTPRLSRRRLLGIATLVLFLLVCWFAPNLVARSPWWPRIFARLTSDLDGQVTAASIELSWLAPITLHDVRITDDAQRPLAKVARISTRSNLLELLWSSGKPETILVHQPDLIVRLSRTGSNWEELLAPLWDRPAAANLEVGRIMVDDAQITIQGNTPELSSTMQLAKATVNLPTRNDPAGRVELGPSRVICAKKSGQYHGDICWQNSDSCWDWSVNVAVDSVPLKIAEILATRFCDELQVDGEMTGELQLAWNAGNRGLDAKMNPVRIVAAELKAPAWFGHDRLVFNQLQVQGSCKLRNDQWQLHNTAIDCDLGQLNANGTVNWAPDSSQPFWQQLVTALLDANVDVNGELDLARVSAALPETLHLREGTLVESGNLQITLQGQQQKKLQHWRANAEVRGFAARHEQQRITWDEPIEFSLEAAQRPEGWRVDQLHCSSSFFQLDLQGTPTAGSFQLNCDLQRLTAEMDRLIQLDAWQAEGKLKANAKWQREGNQQFVARGTGSATNLLVNIGDLHWQTPQVQAAATAEGVLRDSTLIRLTAAQLVLETERDELKIDLAEPIDHPQLGSDWALDVLARGELAEWSQRLQPLLSRPLDFSGPVELRGRATVSGSEFKFRDGQCNIAPFRLSSPHIMIDEPEVDVQFAGVADFGTGRWRIEDVGVRSPSIALRVTDLAGNWSNPRSPSSATSSSNAPRGSQDDNQGPPLVGMVAIRADLARLHESWHLPGPATDWRAAGQLEGQLSMSRLAEQLAARWSITLQDAMVARWMAPAESTHASVSHVARRWQPVWTEQQLASTGSLRYDRQQDTWQLERLQLSSADQLQLTLRGTVAQPLNECQVDLAGELSYDLARFMPRVQPYVGDLVRASGQGSQSFWIRGPLGPVLGNPQADAGSSTKSISDTGSPARNPTPWQQLAGQAALSWSTAQIFGLPTGPGQLLARLKQGVVSAEPVQFAVSDGQVNFVPRLDMNSSPVRLQVDPGQVLENVHLSPQICNTWFQYIAPVAAEATRAQGRFSLQLDRCSVPLTGAPAADVHGTLLVQQAGIGPGPLAQRLLTLTDQLKAILKRQPLRDSAPTYSDWITLPAQSIPFQWSGGRVRHQHLQMQVRDVTLYTTGSVGLDNSVDLLVRIPLQDSWVQRDPALAWLRGQTLEIPISGTLNQPRIDERALAQLSKDMLKNAAGRILENELQRGLNQLFGPGP
jgi:translocation and assembly module TamB